MKDVVVDEQVVAEERELRGGVSERAAWLCGHETHVCGLVCEEAADWDGVSGWGGMRGIEETDRGRRGG